MPGHAERRAYRIFDGNGQGELVLESPHREYDGRLVGGGDIDHTGGYAAFSRRRRLGRILRRRRDALVCRYGNRMAESAERIQAHGLCPGMAVVLV